MYEKLRNDPELVKAIVGIFEYVKSMTAEHGQGPRTPWGAYLWELNGVHVMLADEGYTRMIKTEDLSCYESFDGSSYVVIENGSREEVMELARKLCC